MAEWRWLWSVRPQASESGIQWDLLDEVVEIVDTRQEVINAAERLFANYGGEKVNN